MKTKEKRKKRARREERREPIPRDHRWLAHRALPADLFMALCVCDHSGAASLASFSLSSALHTTARRCESARWTAGYLAGHLVANLPRARHTADNGQEAAQDNRPISAIDHHPLSSLCAHRQATATNRFQRLGTSNWSAANAYERISAKDAIN